MNTPTKCLPLQKTLGLSRQVLYLILGHRTEKNKAHDFRKNDSAVNPHISFESVEELACDEDVINYLMPMPESIDVYVTCEENTIRIENGELKTMGYVYLISHSKIQKLDETLK